MDMENISILLGMCGFNRATTANLDSVWNLIPENKNFSRITWRRSKKHISIKI